MVIGYLITATVTPTAGAVWTFLSLNEVRSRADSVREYSKIR